MNTALLFVHVPKSAGTSFRNALELKYGTDNILRDYSYQAKETSTKIKHLIYDSGDYYALSKELNSCTRVLTGHFPASKYVRLFSIKNVITFVREPVKRVISEYKHYIRHKNYKGTLIEFANLPSKINAQKHCFRGVPISSIGLIGITEYYEESISLLNTSHQLDIPVLFDNSAPNSNWNSSAIDEADIEKIKRLNKDDCNFYKSVLLLHRQRMNISKLGLQYVFGQFHLLAKQHIGGWAYYEDSCEPVLVDVHWNGCKQLEVIANQYNMEINSFNCPRKGYVGFNIKLPKECDVRSVQCFAKNTGQLLVDMVNTK